MAICNNRPRRLSSDFSDRLILCPKGNFARSDFRHRQAWHLGCGSKVTDSLRACSKGYPVTFDPKLHRELKPADDHFLFLYLALPIKLNLQGLSGVPKSHRFQCILTPTMRHSKQRNSFTKRNHEKQVVLRRESSKIVKIIHKNREGIAGTLKGSHNYAIE